MEVKGQLNHYGHEREPHFVPRIKPVPEDEIEEFLYSSSHQDNQGIPRFAHSSMLVLLVHFVGSLSFVARVPVEEVCS